MKILQIANFAPERNVGTPGTIMDLGDALTAAGQEVSYVWRGAPPSPWGQNFSRFIEVPRRQLHQARTALAQARYDVVLVHQPHGYSIFEQLAPQYPKTLFLNFSHGWELCSPSYTPPNAGVVRKIKDRLSAALTRQHCERAAQFANGVIVLNRLDAEFLIQQQNVPREKICVLPLGLDPQLLLQPIRPAAAAGQPARFLFTGNYVAQKGIEILETALLALASDGVNFSYTCVTHTDQHAGMQQRLGPHLDTRLNLLGWQPREALIPLYHNHDFLLFPSRYEGFGKVAHEAMACGLPVVGARVGVLADRAIHQENALLSPPGDLEQFLANLRQAAAAPQLANLYGPRARTAVSGDTWAGVAKSFLSFVEQRQKQKASAAN